MKNENGRRDFLKISALATLGAMFPGWAKAEKKGTQACEITTSDIPGPYYKPDAPFTTTLASANEAGERIIISGKVFKADCLKPIENAVVDVWGADTSGTYHDEKLRGRMYTDAGGRYSFETIFPANYDLGGGQFRPRHLHFKVTTANLPTLTTQLYFAGDPYINNDPWASVPAAKNRTIQLTKKDGKWYGEFDVILDILSGNLQLEEFQGYMRQNFPNPMHTKTTINFGINNADKVALNIFDTNGRLVKTLIDQKLERGRYSVDWNGRNEFDNPLGNGIYLCQLRLGTSQVKEMKIVIQS
jgi:protocatechuate 3,4-dioxygenase beta subunit